MISSGTRQDVSYLVGSRDLVSGSRVHAVILHDISDEIKKACIYTSTSLSLTLKVKSSVWLARVFSPLCRLLSVSVPVSHCTGGHDRLRNDTRAINATLLAKNVLDCV